MRPESEGLELEESSESERGGVGGDGGFNEKRITAGGG